ncbi:MAG TPA: hypothetical protein DGT53_02005 [Dialister sp.]|nr:hypothetical protein [Dialister sp.]
MTRFPVEQSGAARIGGSERNEPVSRLPIKAYDKESQSRNVDFILIARRAIPSPLNTLNPLNLLNPRAKGASPLKKPSAVGQRAFFI